MGLVKKILGAVLGLFAGLAGLLGLGKKADSYYLDLSDGTTKAPAQVAAAQPKAAAAQPKAAAAQPKAAAPAAVAAAANTVTPIPAITFADMAAIPLSTGGRRRPGPSLDKFKDMAKEVGRR